MSKLKKIFDHELDTEKEVLICGKGSTATMVLEENIDNKYIVCLNSSSIFLPRVDFLFITDMERFDSFLRIEKEICKIKNIVCPIQIHQFETPSKFTYLDVFDRLSDYDINLFTYSLQTQNIKDPDDDRIDKFKFGPEPMHSSYICSLFWLINAGFTKFKIFGISTNGVYADEFVSNGEYGKLAVGPKTIPKSWFLLNYNIGIKILKRNKCEFKIY